MPNPAVFAEPWAELTWRPIAVTQVVSLPAERLCPPAIEVSATSLPQAAAITAKKIVVSAATPRAVSLTIKPITIRTASYSFRPPAIGLLNPEARILNPAPETLNPEPRTLNPRPATRFKPPADTVKLEDRLYYLLQPSLETLITEGALEFPFHPFPYQFEGVAFLYPRVAAVLADEMGLGKTMQAITALRLLLHAGEIRSVLLVCPKPLVTNWRREFAMWAPELPIGVIEGDQAKRHWQWGADVPVKIANYEVLLRDLENGDLEKGDILLFDEAKTSSGRKECPEANPSPSQGEGRERVSAFTPLPTSPLKGRGVLQRTPLYFDLVVIDEAQRIKNRAGTTSQIVRAIRRTRSWALTGTPVENSPDDLVGIFEFVAPGHLNREMKPRAMGRAAADYILRRTKDKVLADLPPKLFRDANVELSREQRNTYTMAEDEGVLRLTEMGEGATIQHVFELVLRLKQICNFDPATGESSKLERLVADLEEVAASGRKAIVFSQWVATLAVLEQRLRRFGVMEYHGQIPSRKRDAVIDQFMHDRRKHVILMTYGAGGVGLNLQFCGYVFLFDRWWNPAVEDQAINRAHRIGAAGPVTVTRFLTLDTIEERINQVLEEKRELFDTIFSSAAGHRSLGFTQQEIFGLFKLRSPQGPINAAA